jgi:Zn-dependent peptidase ImmA (M78 family)
MRIPERTWELIEQGDTRARFTFMHELGHLILQHDFSLHRENVRYVHKSYEDSEWQADQFAAEILMPVSVINDRKLFDAYDLAEFFDVSLKAASIRLQQLTKRNELEEGR